MQLRDLRRRRLTASTPASYFAAIRRAEGPTE